MISAAILAGGKATRMGGRPKSFLTVEGRRIIDRQLEVLRPLFSRIVISANDPAMYAEFDLPVLRDEVTDQGPLSGILAAVEAAAPVVVVACDMPYLTPEALRALRDTAPEADVVVPVLDGRPEPLFARYSARCAPAIRGRLARGDRKITRFYEDVATVELDPRAIDPALRFLRNCNTPEDLP